MKVFFWTVKFNFKTQTPQIFGAQKYVLKPENPEKGNTLQYFSLITSLGSCTSSRRAWGSLWRGWRAAPLAPSGEPSASGPSCWSTRRWVCGGRRGRGRTGPPLIMHFRLFLIPTFSQIPPPPGNCHSAVKPRLWTLTRQQVGRYWGEGEFRTWNTSW